MPDQLTDDNLTDLFADLRADALPRVLPPGVADVRRTVRRRRRQTVSAVAGIALLVLMGGLAQVAVHRVTSTSVTAADIPVSNDVLDGYAARAEQLVTADSPKNATLRSGTVAAGYTARTDVPNGMYVLRLACVGSGNVQAAVMLGPTTVLGTASVECSPDGRLNSTKLAVPDVSDMHFYYGEAHVNLKLISSRGERAASFAAMLAMSSAEALEDRVDAVVAADGATGILTSRGTFDETTRRDESESAPAGRYALRVTCAGFGRMTVTAGRPAAGPGTRTDTMAHRVVECTRQPQLVELVFRLDKAGPLFVQLAPDAAAKWRAAYAYVLHRR